MKKALILQGGWAGHHPAEFAALFADQLKAHGIESQVESSLAILENAARLRDFALVVPCWTMGSLSPEQSKGLVAAVRDDGVALGGAHGGMGDAFRGDLDYEWMVGGHFVGHPHVGDYQVRIADAASPITQGIHPEFTYRSEQYYLLVDPGVHVLADTVYSYEGREVKMPVAWTKTWGKGRVFYSSLGHALSEYTEFPEALALTVRGMAWAADALWFPGSRLRWLPGRI